MPHEPTKPQYLANPPDRPTPPPGEFTVVTQLPAPTTPPAASKVAFLQPGAVIHHQAGPPKPRRTRIDLERLEIDYRSGKQTVREIGEAHGITNGRVVQIAKERGWVQDIRDRARVQAAAMIADFEKVKPATKRLSMADIPGLSNEATLSVVDATAASMAHVRLKHREGVTAQREFVGELFSEAQANSQSRDVIEQARQALATLNDDGGYDKLIEATQRLVSLPSRVSTVRALADATKTLIALERQAYDLDAPPSDTPPAPADRSRSPQEHYVWFCGYRPFPA